MWQAAAIDNLNIRSFKYKDPVGLGPREITDRGYGIAKTDKILGSFPMKQEQRNHANKFTLLLHNFSAPISQEMFQIRLRLQQWKTVSQIYILLEKITQSTKMRRRERRQWPVLYCAATDISTRLKVVLCPRMKGHRRECTKSSYCIFLHDLAVMVIHTWTLWQEKSTSKLNIHWQSLVQCTEVIDA